MLAITPNSMHFGYRTREIPCSEPPEKYYHLTTVENWEKIKRAGSIRPKQSSVEDIMGIFTVDAANLKTHWSRRSPSRGSPLASLIRSVNQRHKSRELALLEINHLDHQTVQVRNNIPLFQPIPDKEAFKASLQSLDHFLASDNNRTLPEFIITEPVSVRDIRCIGTLKPGRFRINQHDFLKLLFDDSSLQDVPKYVNTFLSRIRDNLKQHFQD